MKCYQCLSGICFFSFLILISCTENHSDQPQASFKKKEIVPAGVAILAGTPTITNPDTCPPPHKTAILKKQNSSLLSSKGDASFFVTMQNYNTEQGLALSSVLSGYQDNAGNLWFGTDAGGVSRYDGKSFTNFTTASGLAGNSVMSIAGDKSGNLWFGTNGNGVSKYDGRCFTTFSTAQNLAGNVVISITEDKRGNLWFGTETGAFVYDGKSFTTYTTANGLMNKKVNSIAEDRAGNMWFGTDGGASVYNGKTFTTYTVADGLAGNKVYSIAVDTSGTIWLGTDKGATRYNGRFMTINGMAGTAVAIIFIDKTGSVWMGTYLNGVTCYDPSVLLGTAGKSYLTFTTVQGLANNNVRSITEDKDGNLWFGTYGGGVSRYAGKSFSSFTTDQGLADNSINNIIEDAAGTIWFATQGFGVSYYDGRRFGNYTATDGLANNTVLSMYDDKGGNVWIGTKGHGVSRYDGNSFINYTTEQGLAHNTIWVITQDQRGNVWFGTEGGVTRYDGKFFSTYTIAQGLAKNKVRCITEDTSGNIWFGTSGGGVSLFDGKYFSTFTTAQGLGGNNIFCITSDSKGNLWIGSEEGGVSFLSRDLIEGIVIKKVNSTRETLICEGLTFRNFTTKEGLADNVVYDLVEDRNGNIVIGTNLGFTILKGGYDSANESFAKNGIEYFNQKTGYAVKDINVNAMYVDSKGIIWAATGDKLVRFDYDAIPKTSTTPVVVIQNLKLNNENISWYDLENSKNKIESLKQDTNKFQANITEEGIIFGSPLSDAKRNAMCNVYKNVFFDSITPFYPLPVNLVLPIQDNNLTFDYAAIEPARPFLVHYQFMLEGYDKSWNPITERTSASFGNLFEGNYTFKLKAQSPEGIWSEPVTYSFKVLPPPYRTWWAYTVYVLVFLFFLRSIIRWREGALKQEKEILESKVIARTDELRKERDRSESLLLNIFPAEIAEELKETGASHPKNFNEVTVMFTDFKNFTEISEQLDAQQLVGLIDFCYREFDSLIAKNNIEKIKTIGDSYMCAGGLSVDRKTSTQDTVMAALAIRDFMIKEKIKREAEGKIFFEIRIGLHTGPVVAGIVGIKKYAYDIWGDTVNIASRMESSSDPGKVNISEHTYQLIKDKFKCTHRGAVESKHKRMIDMYFVEKLWDV